MTIPSLLKHKNSPNKGMRSVVAYKYQCPGCGARFYYEKPVYTSCRASEQDCIYPILLNLISATMYLLQWVSNLFGQFLFNGTNNNLYELKIVESLHCVIFSLNLSSTVYSQPTLCRSYVICFS